jgi:hypothetical protein
MIPRAGLARNVTVVSEDVLGPMRNSLYIELLDGSYVSVDEKSAMLSFVADLERNRPLVAASIRAALASVPKHCTEQLFDLEDE